jgi:hypothetical protein
LPKIQPRAALPAALFEQLDDRGTIEVRLLGPDELRQPVVDGGGLVGPNLTDNYWIHGSNFADNVTTIWNGVPAKGMITWKNMLKPQEIYDVASYIYTLRGTHPPNPKPPENQAPVKTGPREFE